MDEFSEKSVLGTLPLEAHRLQQDLLSVKDINDKSPPWHCRGVSVAESLPFGGSSGQQPCMVLEQTWLRVNSSY